MARYRNAEGTKGAVNRPWTILTPVQTSLCFLLESFYRNSDNVYHHTTALFLADKMIHIWIVELTLAAWTSKLPMSEQVPRNLKTETRMTAETLC